MEAVIISKKYFLLIFGALFFSVSARAEFDMECFLKGNCHSARSSASNPSVGSQVKINPSAVPTEAGFGIEGILFKDQVDVALVRGLGRVGAAISPANSEETFFGPPGFEDPQDYLERNIEATKFPSQKYTLATAFSLAQKDGSDLNSYSFKLGLMGKYNKYTKNVSPGGGLSGVLGPVTFGVSYYKDEEQMEVDLDETLRPPPLEYNVQTYNIGLFLHSVILDYSYLRLTLDQDISEVNLYTGSLLVSRFIFTVSKRIERSGRPSYNRDTKSLEFKETKDRYFGGAQYSINKHFLVGVLYNYYLLDELAVMGTVFF
jgi:hypothetical protein